MLIVVKIDILRKINEKSSPPPPLMQNKIKTPSKACLDPLPFLPGLHFVLLLRQQLQLHIGIRGRLRPPSGLLPIPDRLARGRDSGASRQAAAAHDRHHEGATIRQVAQFEDERAQFTRVRLVDQEAGRGGRRWRRSIARRSVLLLRRHGFDVAARLVLGIHNLPLPLLRVPHHIVLLQRLLLRLLRNRTVQVLLRRQLVRARRRLDRGGRGRLLQVVRRGGRASAR